MAVSFSIESLITALVILVMVVVVGYWGDIRSAVRQKLNNRKADARYKNDRY